MESDGAGSAMAAADAKTSAPSRNAEVVLTKEEAEGEYVTATWRQVPSHAGTIATPLSAAVAEPPETMSAAACVDARPGASPAAPQTSAAAYKRGAAHLTQALALHATLPPLGSADGAPAPEALR